LIDPYDAFLSRAATALAPSGAIPLLPHGVTFGVEEGFKGWDQILLVDNPGEQTVYAFTEVTSRSMPVQARVDSLAKRLAGTPLQPSSPLNVVFVIASGAVLDEKERRSLVRTVPAAYYAGLRPATWVVDLPHGQMVKRGGGSLPGASEIEAALQSGWQAPDPLHVESLRRAQVQRAQAFYDLMRGTQPIVTYALVLVNVLVYLAVQLNGGPDSDHTLVHFGALVPRLVEQGQWWRLFTVMFLHASIPHIFFNMLSLVIVGMVTERLYGSLRFLAIYLGAGLIGAATSFLFAVLTGDTNMVAVGASGAIFGIVGALLTLRFQRSDIIPASIRNRISVSMIPIVVLNLFLGLTTQYIDNSAHIGGLLGGAVLSFVFPLTGMRRPGLRRSANKPLSLD
jgi:membrane associated rhomboid family serine protease